ncbi:hypothetical protein ABK040_005482 [Willaertia magna]
MSEKHERFDFAVCGGGGVGKSCITIRITQERYIGDFHDPTIEDSYDITRVIDGKSVQLTINDTAGQEEYRVIVDLTLRKVFGYILVFDSTVKSSLEELKVFVTKIRNLREGLEKQYKLVDGVDFPCVVVAAKSDLPNGIPEKEVKRFMIDELHLSTNVPLLYVSAKENKNIHTLLESIVRQMRSFSQGQNTVSTPRQQRRSSFSSFSKPKLFSSFFMQSNKEDDDMDLLKKL